MRGVLAASALLISGCGGHSSQNADEPSGTFAVQVLHASFPARQSIARPTQLRVTVRNRGSQTMPVVAVTLNTLNYTEHHPELADNKRPIWVIERGPGPVAHPAVETQEVSQLGDAQTAYVNTWALGPLPPGRARTFLWELVPVKSGLYTVHYAVAAGLSGKAKAQLVSGAPAQGKFIVHIAAAPPITQVNPNTGQVVPGRYPLAVP